MTIILVDQLRVELKTKLMNCAEADFAEASSADATGGAVQNAPEQVHHLHLLFFVRRCAIPNRSGKASQRNNHASRTKVF